MQYSAKYLVPAMATLSLVLANVSSARGQSYSDRVLVNDPTFLWTLDDIDVLDIPISLGSSVVDAVFNGGITLGQDGLVPDEPDNKSASFNGSDAYVDIPDHEDINVSSGPWPQKSWSLWFNATDVNIATPQVLYEEGGTTRGANLYIRGGEVFVGAWNNANDDSGLTTPWISGEDDPPGGHIFVSTPIESGITYHLTMVMEGDEAGKAGFLRGYLNGGLFEEKTGVGQLFNHGANVAIGRKNGDTYYDTGSSGGSGDYFGGLIDEVALFNTALAEDLISVHLGLSDVTAGDFNSDGQIDMADFGILTSNFNTFRSFPESLSLGDINRDSRINLADFREFRNIFNSQGGGAAAAVPEPSTVTLLIGLAGTLMLPLRRRSQR